MDFALTAEQQAFKDRFGAFCRERIAPRAAAADREGRLPSATWADLREVGYFQMFHPPAIGGSGADGITLALAMESLGAACASTLWAATISTALCGKILHNLCGPRHHEQWLRPIATGRRVGCFAATERGAGSDPASYATTLRRSTRGCRLRGEKSRISNAGVADVAIVLARHVPEDSSEAGEELCYVVVDLRRPGVSRVEQDKMGLRAMSWGALAFDDVEVEVEDVIVGADMGKTLQAVEWGQLLQVFSAIGIADAAYEACASFATQREAFGRPIAHLPIVHARLAEMHTSMDAVRLLAWEAAAVKGQGRTARELVMMAKIYATERSVQVVDAAMRTFGGWGYSKEHAIERLYRDSLANVPAGLPTDRLRELLVAPLLEVDPWRYDPFDWLSPAGLRF
jgi:alkylation response protein AidB-like acyl-CoA dehydrogenase